VKESSIVETANASRGLFDLKNTYIGMKVDVGIGSEELAEGRQIGMVYLGRPKIARFQHINFLGNYSIVEPFR
jgi:hypothetical protein